MKMSDADRTQILNACQFLRDRGYSLVDSDEYSINLSDGVRTFSISYGMRCDGITVYIKFIKEDEVFPVLPTQDYLDDDPSQSCLSYVLCVMRYVNEHYDEVIDLDSIWRIHLQDAILWLKANRQHVIGADEEIKQLQDELDELNRIHDHDET